MPILENLRAVNFQNAQVNLWVVKGPTGSAAEDPKYSARWVETTDDVDVVLRNTVAAEIARVEEVHEYGLLVQNNEASALQIPADETHSDLLLAKVSEEVAARKVTELKHLRNANFYVGKFVIDGSVAYAVKKAGSGWKTKKAVNVRSLFFSDAQLDLDDRPHFELSQAFDFIVFGEQVLVLNKGVFESILRHKVAHREEFEALQAEVGFQAVFLDMAPLTEYIGDNKIQLRRACAIRQKGHYRDPQFMERLRLNQAEYGFAIQFDAAGRIIVTPETCQQVMKALLDHRLKSGFSRLVYDVQDTSPVVI